MINAINTTSLGSLLSANSSGGGSEDGTTGGFDAALIAAQRAEQRQQEHESLMDSIRSKGFSNWVRDEQIEALKEKLRKQVMADMGLTEDDLSRMSSVIQQILEQKIQKEVDNRLQEEMAKQENGGQKNGGQADGKTEAKTASATTTQQTGKNDRDGKDCPVIPALSWPGGASLF